MNHSSFGNVYSFRQWLFFGGNASSSSTVRPDGQKEGVENHLEPAYKMTKIGKKRGYNHSWTVWCKKILRSSSKYYELLNFRLWVSKGSVTVVRRPSMNWSPELDWLEHEEDTWANEKVHIKSLQIGIVKWVCNVVGLYRIAAQSLKSHPIPR